jgi:hypothetical protein
MSGFIENSVKGDSLCSLIVFGGNPKVLPGKTEARKVRGYVSIRSWSLLVEKMGDLYDLTIANIKNQWMV